MSTVHCWKDELEWIEERYGYLSAKYLDYVCGDMRGTCMLLEGHAGDHKFDDDDKIVVQFKGNETPNTAERKGSR